MNVENGIPEEIVQMNTYLRNIKQESDRGAVLSFAAVVEDRLKEIIILFLVDNKSAAKLLDGFNAPIGTFSSKILMAHALGLISDKEFHEIEILRKIRNVFAHSWENIDFRTSKIENLLFNLPTFDKTSEKRNNPKEFFYNWASLLLIRLLYRNDLSIKEKRKVSEFDMLSQAIEKHPDFS